MNVTLLKSSRFWTIVLVTSILLLSFSPRNFLADSLTTDPASYHSHAFSLALDFDLDYRNEPLMCLNERTHVPCHPIGSGLFAAPFVLVFSLLDHLSGDVVLNDHRDFQYSWSFFGFSFSHSVYFIAGLWLFTLGLARVGLSIARWRMLLYSAGFGMAYYTFQSVQMSHVYQFFALALTFWAATGMWQAFDTGRSTLPHSLLAAVGVVLTIAIRPADVIVVALPGIVFFTLWAVQREGDRAMAGGALKVAGSYIAAVGLAFAPLAWFNWLIYGSWFPTPSEMYGETMTPVQAALDKLPLGGQAAVAKLTASDSDSLGEAAGVVWDHFVNLLFSSEFGVLYTSPIFIFGTLALLVIVLVRHANLPLAALNLLTIVAYLAIPIAVVLYWRTTASFYGFRYLYPLFPIAVFGYALFVRKYLLERRRVITTVPKTLIDLVLLGFCAVALLSQIFYGSSEALALHRGINSFGKWHHLGASGYMWGLADAVASPSAWFQAAAHRMPGFIGAELLPALSVNLADLGAKFGISADVIEVGLARYQGLPTRAVIQVFAAFVFNLIIICHYLGLVAPGSGESPSVRPEPEPAACGLDEDVAVKRKRA